MTYEQIGKQIGALVDEKNKVYGDSFHESGKIIEILYPYGIQVNQYKDFLTVIRVVDKLFRIATARDAFGESPWKDVAGYALLASKDSVEKETWEVVPIPEVE